MNKETFKVEDFQEWKEANKWFWDHLTGVQEQFEGLLEGIKERVLYCPSSEVEDVRRAAVELDAKISCIKEIIDLDYEDVVDE